MLSAMWFVIQLVRSSKDEVITFPFQDVRGRGALKVSCVQSVKQLWPSHQLAVLHCAQLVPCGLSCSLSNQAKIRSSIFSHAVWLSYRTDPS